MSRALRPFSMSVVAAVLLMQPPCAHAQQRTPISEQSEKAVSYTHLTLPTIYSV